MTEEKFEYIFKRYRNLVMNEAYEVLKDFHLAQDVCQEVFFKLSFERLDKLKTDTDMKRYIKSVAFNRAIDHYRKKQRENEVFFEDEEDALADFNMDEKLSRDEFMGEMFLALGKLNPVWCEIVRRVGFYDEDAIIVARDMNITVNHLRVMYHRAKIWIRKNFADEYEYLNDLF